MNQPTKYTRTYRKRRDLTRIMGVCLSQRLYVPTYFARQVFSGEEAGSEYQPKLMVVVYSQGKPVAWALKTIKNWDWFYTKPAFRKQGIATRLRSKF